MSARFLRFLVVGAVNTLFSYTCYAALIYVGLVYPIAALFSTIAGVVFNFGTTGRLVFGNRDNRLILRFVGVYSLVYIVNVLSLRILMRQMGLNAYVAGGACVLPLALLSYSLLRRHVFRPT